MSSVGVPFAIRALLRPRLSTHYFPTNTAFPNISHHGRVAISGNARNSSSITKVFYKIIPRSNAQAIRPKWLFAGASLAAAVIGFYVSESPYHAVMALERTMRVASATARCIQESASISQPIEWTSTFIPLQDKCPRSSVEDIDRMIQKDTGCTISELFSEFDEEPIGTGKPYSRHTAQVSILSSRADFSPSKKHPWLRFTGLGSERVVKSKVAVKLQHPSLAEWVPLDLALTRFALTNIKFFFPEYPMDWLSEEMELSLPVELDFEEEAKNIYRVTEHFKHVPNTALVVPRVVWAKKRILVLEYLRGHRVDDLSSLDRAGISRDEVSASLAHIFNEMIFGNNAPLHCDPHHGNLAIRPNQNRKGHNFDIILYDHGLYREIPLSTRRSYAKLWLAVLDGDEDKMRIYASEVAGITAEQFPLFASAITGRDFVTVKASVSTARSETEKEHIAAAMADGMLSQLVQLLANVPRIILLILKTNDLTRSLDESLQSSIGPERTFLIMADYCSRAVFDEEKEMIAHNGGLSKPGNIARMISALFFLCKIKLKLVVRYIGGVAMSGLKAVSDPSQ
ncbi:hypothetical protein AOL_s00188g8 [Orbilia oligospora ATCC 24927]|uniref:ABC1 atypical kinase-like domain-containing protein n=1 Tax=Arthrobotrys oligospora (strain ATCC 24927 / CBS 115.81 / DSM 1491) TaxID=756982 RepID=G1XPZ7_ARTOA|nr:hypothetical protein AOL_s00188g8 [Orbilia oligospora ATCC 24927]EGX44670.1 hypothetical protein AOL_s00188g8 [Orbilia oligospora ATCC 24927]